MGNAYVGNAASFLISTIIGFLVLATLLRLMFAWLRADFYNPLSQFVVKVTNWAVLPLRRVIPPVGKIDSAVFVLLLGLQMLESALVALVSGFGVNPLGLPFWAIGELLDLLVLVFIVSIIVEVVLSWVAPNNYNPMVDIILRLNRPVMEPARRLLPPMSGFDLSPLVALIALQLIRMLLVAPIRDIGMGLTISGAS